jgi:hypothetical protein
MKKLVILGTLTMIASIALAAPQKKSFTTARGHAARPTPTPPPVTTQNVEGALPRAFQQGGNPLQMLNPKAPAKYGKAEDSVSFDPDIPGKWKGIKFFSFNF